ncbi:hypothetical protein [Kaistia sp. MMO-174]|uniref:hypothetical protein n=1 Tax=Kaistia sp. MMO-174 TaxID=3081256 RepID=UPI0030188756
MTDTMIERVAAVLRANIKVDATGLAPAVASAFIVGIDEAARAAIEAMRDPTKAVVVAVEQKIAERAAAAPDMLRMYGEDVWDAGIDAALQETKG